MKTNYILALTLSFSLLSGCTESSTEAEAVTDSPVVVAETAPVYSVEEQNKVLGPVSFGDTEEEYKQEIKSIYNEESTIGNFHYLNILPAFYKGELYGLTVEGNRHRSSDYSTRVASDVEALTKMIQGQYGEPVINRELPESYDITNPVRMWEVGPKYISINIEENRQGYNFVTLEIYHGDKQLESYNAYKAEKDSVSNASKELF